ncbi:MAG: ATPase domain-containing protein [Byssovorax sp.]
MTDLVRTVPSGSVGLDLVLGGGVRLLRRIAGSSAESATLLVRGGPGAGKSVLATDIALRMARAVGGDVLYVCIEVLPSEVIAQCMGFDSFDPKTAIDLAQPEARKASEDGPTLVVGMTEMGMVAADDGVDPDLGQMILDLLRISDGRGCSPCVVVVDSLSDGYNLGASVPRETVDGLCKLAVEQGWMLILVEEAVDNRASPWSFAVDTVLSLEVTPEGRREARVTKHRFGPCQPGPHRLLVEREGVRVLPCFAAYRNAVRDLALPEPAKNRSLRVAIVGEASVATSFDVPDGQGRVVLVRDNDIPAPMRTDAFVATIGATAQDDFANPGALVTLRLSESHKAPVDTDSLGLRINTLHEMIDGEEWLEAVLSTLSTITRPIARILIGPTGSLSSYSYTHYDHLQDALKALRTILARKGFVVVIYGSQNPPASGVIPHESWVLSPINRGSAEQIKVNRSGIDIPLSEFKSSLS